MSRQRKTAKSSRIPPQAREYISEMAEDRELERFMALSSTASSGASGSLHTCAVRVNFSTEPAAAHSRGSCSRPGTGHEPSRAAARRPKSRECQPVVGTAAAAASAEEDLLQLPLSPQGEKPLKSPGNSPAADSYRIIPIVLVNDQQGKPRPAAAATQTMSQSVEDLRTPTKLPAEMHTKKTQTPESALKSHKRLEWDPAADVGYYKRAVSTSNISTLERSVLEECGWRQPMQQRSETDLDRLQRQEGEEHRAGAGSPMQEKTTVPLASSTMVSRPVASAGVSGKDVDSRSGSRGEVSNCGSRGAVSNGSSRGEISNGSSRGAVSNGSYRGEPSRRSLRRDPSLSSFKTDASEGSSKREPSQCSSKDEVSNSSYKREDSHSRSRKGTTSLSHSNYQSSHSSSIKETSRIKETSYSSSRKKDLRESSSIEALQTQAPSRRESSINSRRESLGGHSQATSRLSSLAENSHSSSRVGSDLSSRRESQTTSLYGSSAASSFDYHINVEDQEWLKSLQKQQQREPRSTKERKASEDASRADHRGEEDQGKTEHRDRDQRKALRRAEQREKEREQERQYTAAQLERVLGSRRLGNKENQVPPSAQSQTTSATASSSLHADVGPKRDLDLGIDLLCSLVEARSLSQGQKKKLVRDIARRIACLDLAESSSSMTSSSRRTRASAEYKAPDFAVPLQRQEVATNTSLARSQSSCSLRRHPQSVVTLPVPAPRKRNAEGTPSPRPGSSFSATLSSTSGEVITQKANIPPTRDGASTDADAESMSAIQDALNPMTQSEIEYEERMKAGMDPERRSQLNWIELEIERLQSLKVFLGEIKDKLPNSSVPLATDEELMISSDELLLAEPKEMQQEKDNKEEREKEQGSSSAAESGRQKADSRLPKAGQTEILIELEEQPIPKPPVRKESVRVPPRTLNSRSDSDVQAPPLPPPHRYPRTKMATPVLASYSSSSSGGGGGGGGGADGRSESVSSFVQERHRRFREHYQNQQQQQLLLLKQQQLQRLQQEHEQQQQRQQQLYPHKHQPRVVVQGETREIQCPVHGKQHGGQQQRREQREQQEHPEQQQYMQMMQYDQTAASGSAYATPHSSASGCYSCADNERAIYYRVVNSPGASGSYVQAAPAETPAAPARSTTTTTTSLASSSMMCLSSEMSIPMGRVNTCETTTTTTTTTHQYDDVACQRRRRRVVGGVGEERMQRPTTLQVRPRGIAYVIQFTTAGDSEVVPETRSLQDQLQLARPEFCAKSKQRKAILNRMQMMRNLRRREMEQLVEENNCSLETLDKRLLQLPPPATSRLRIFSTREMKAMTTKKCQSLPEVLDAVNREVETRRRRTNRLMRDIFNKRMRNRVSNGQVSLNHSKTII